LASVGDAGAANADAVGTVYGIGDISNGAWDANRLLLLDGEVTEALTGNGVVGADGDAADDAKPINGGAGDCGDDDDTICDKPRLLVDDGNGEPTIPPLAELLIFELLLLVLVLPLL
jgi:hypothetical protein